MGGAVILTLSNSTVAGNEAIGGSGGSTLVYPPDWSALGGGIINIGGGTLNVVGCTITGNQALGGATAKRQGASRPRRRHRQQSRLHAKPDGQHGQQQPLPGRRRAPSGYAGGVAAGGGIGNDRASIAIITNCTLSLNQCIGGAGGAGAKGGDAVGGGIENADLRLRLSE